MDIRTGDLILYDGSHALHRRHRELTGCRWAQVGLLVRSPDSSEVWIFESTRISPCRDMFQGCLIRGVQLSRLSERIAAFDGQVAIRRLSPPLSAVAMAQLWRFVCASHGLPFNNSKWTAVRAYRRRNQPSDNASYFCSELVATTYQIIGVLASPPTGITANNYIPADFANTYMESILRLVPPYSLAPEEDIGVAGSPGASEA